MDENLRNELIADNSHWNDSVTAAKRRPGAAAPNKKGMLNWKYDDRFGLGSSYRLRVVLHYSGLTIDDFNEACGAGGGKVRDAVKWKAKSLTHETVEHVVDFLNAKRATHGLPAISWASFFYERFEGANAVLDFARWITGDATPRHAVELLDLAPSIDWVDRDRLLEVEAELMAFIQREAPETVQVVHGRGMAKGLRAIAAKLCMDIAHNKRPYEGEERRVCYLPAELKPQSSARVSLAQLVAWLRAFYEGRSLSEAVAPDNAADLNKALEVVRRGMLENPAIIVIGPTTSPGRNVGALRGLLSGEPVHELLPLLLHPMDALSVQADPAAFYRTRIIVLADMDLDGVAPFGATPIEVPQSSETILRRRLRAEMDDYPFHKFVEAQIKAHHPIKSETGLIVFNALGGLLHARNAAGANVRDISPSSLLDAVRAYCDLLKSRPLELIALQFIALCSDGCRIASLHRFLEAWRVCENEDAKVAASAARTEAVAPEPPVSIEDVEAIVASHELLLREFVDDPLPGEPRGSALRTIDFRSREVRELALEVFFWDKNATQLRAARLHRIIAEECLRQQTEIMRRGPVYSREDTRFMRRLFQAVFHGLCSVALGKERDTGLRALKKVFPADRYRAFVRLYAVFYRLLQEAPPNWDLARMRGKELLKSDLLLVAGNIDKMESGAITQFYKRADASSGPDIPSFLEPDGDNEATDRNVAIALDLVLGLARSSFNTGRKKDTERALELADNVLFKYRRIVERAAAEAKAAAERELADWRAAVVAPRGGPDSPQDRSREQQLDDLVGGMASARLATLTREGALEAGELAVAKVRFDLQMLDDVDVRAEIEKALSASGFVDGWQARLSKLRERTRQMRAAAEIVAAVDAELGALAEQAVAEKTSESRLVAWGDLLARHGECRALVVDRGEAANPSDDPTPDLFMAFLTMKLADRFRRQAFQREPLGRAHIASSHSIRAFVRTSLLLYSRVDDGPRAYFGCAMAPYFGDEARRQADLLARYFFRFPTERPSMLIIEAKFDRLIGGDLRAAASSLERAEKLMNVTEERPRVRMRLLLERSRVYGAIAKANSGGELDPVEQDRLLGLASRDAKRLSLLANRVQNQFWDRVAKDNEEATDKLAELCRRARVQHEA